MSDEGNNFTDDTTTSSFVPVERQRFDSTINRGKRLIEIFKNCKLRIIIGRTKSDSFGKPTFHGKNGTSVVGYIIYDHDYSKQLILLLLKHQHTYQIIAK